MFFVCGYKQHRHSKYPAWEVTYKSCNKVSYFQRICQSSRTKKCLVTYTNSILSNIFSSDLTPSPFAIVKLFANGLNLNALVNTGSSDSYIPSHKFTLTWLTNLSIIHADFDGRYSLVKRYTKSLFWQISLS